MIDFFFLQEPSIYRHLFFFVVLQHHVFRRTYYTFEQSLPSNTTIIIISY